MNPSTRRTSPTSIAPMTHQYLPVLELTEAQPEMRIAVAAVVVVADADRVGRAVAEARAAAAS